MTKTLEYIADKIKESEVDETTAIASGDMLKQLIALRIQCELLEVRNKIISESLTQRILNYEISPN